MRFLLNKKREKARNSEATQIKICINTNNSTKVVHLATSRVQVQCRSSRTCIWWTIKIKMLTKMKKRRANRMSSEILWIRWTVSSRTWIRMQGSPIKRAETMGRRGCRCPKISWCSYWRMHITCPSNNNNSCNKSFSKRWKRIWWVNVLKTTKTFIKY